VVRKPEVELQSALDRTDGIPLFVEEMTKAVLEAESDIGPTPQASNCSVASLTEYQASA